MRIYKKCDRCGQPYEASPSDTREFEDGIHCYRVVITVLRHHAETGTWPTPDLCAGCVRALVEHATRGDEAQL